VLIERLAYSPAIESDETLWSWMTRVGLYYGWSADEFLRLMGSSEVSWEGYFRQLDVDCDAPADLLERLAEITGFELLDLKSHQVERRSSTLWLDDRVAFCETCWSDTTAMVVPYVRRAWLDAWCIDCPIHGNPLVTIAKVYRPRYAADWNAAWASRPDWAEGTNAVCTQSNAELVGRGAFVIVRPPGAVASHRFGTDAGKGSSAQTANADQVARQVPTPEPLERQLVLLAGRRWGEFSLARAFFDVHERISWRNAHTGYDPERPVVEPVGTLTMRSGAIRIGRALFDILLERTYREPRIADPLRRWISGMFGKPRQWLISDVSGLAPSVRLQWKRQFEWEDEFEWVRGARAAPMMTAVRRARDSP
jgi:hypothetical protein